MTSEIPPTHHQYNLEINEAIEKLYLNININSKDQREKGILELHKTFLSILSKHLEKKNEEEISDLILDKSIHLSEITQEFDWPSAESLKVPNLYRFANQLYIYVRTRLNLLSGKGKKHIKEGALKGVENLITILNSLVEGGINLENNLIFLCFEDLFSFYCMTNESEKQKLKEPIENLITFAMEETNISDLAKMNNPIGENVKKYLFIGTLAVMLKFKINLVLNNEKSIQENLIDIENIFKHEKDLRKIHLLTDTNLTWVFLCYKFINTNENTTNFEYCKTCMELLQNLKIYNQFLDTNKNKFIDIVKKNISKIRSLIVFYFVNNYINLNELFFLKMDYNQQEIDDIKGLSIHNLFPMKKYLKSKIVEDYTLLKFDEKLIEKLEKNAEKNIDKEEMKKLSNQYNELISEKTKKIEIKDIKANENYLKERLTNKNKKYDDLLSKL